MPIKRKPNAGLSHRRKYKYGSREFVPVTEMLFIGADEEAGDEVAGPPVTQLATNDNTNALHYFCQQEMWSSASGWLFSLFTLIC
jgi:hypothetical protein